VMAQQAVQPPTSLHPATETSGFSAPRTNGKKFFASKRQSVFSHSKKQKAKHTARYEFYERVEKAAKAKQRSLKQLARRQYTDPRYFGHKRLPKRRLPHKMRYCDACGIRH